MSTNVCQNPTPTVSTNVCPNPTYDIPKNVLPIIELPNQGLPTQGAPTLGYDPNDIHKVTLGTVPKIELIDRESGEECRHVFMSFCHR